MTIIQYVNSVIPAKLLSAWGNMNLLKCETSNKLLSGKTELSWTWSSWRGCWFVPFHPESFFICSHFTDLTDYCRALQCKWNRSTRLIGSHFTAHLQRMRPHITVHPDRCNVLHGQYFGQRDTAKFRSLSKPHRSWTASCVLLLMRSFCGENEARRLSLSSKLNRDKSHPEYRHKYSSCEKTS